MAELAQSHAPEAIRRLAELMRDRKSIVAIKACIAILDRAVGRPHQSVAHEIADTSGSTFLLLADDDTREQQ